MSRIRSGRPAKPVSSEKRAPSRKQGQKPLKAGASTSSQSRAKARIHARAKASDDTRPDKGKERALEESDEEFEGFTMPKMGVDSGDERGRFDKDDEELDSDLADTSGEDEPSTSKRKAAKKPAKLRQPQIDLEEDDEASELDEEGDAFMDISEMLDGAEAASESEDSADSFSADEEDVEGLDDFVDSLPKTNKRAEEGDGESPRKKRRILPERTEATEENEYAAIGVNDQGKLRLEDMLSMLPAGQKAAMRKNLKALASTQPAIGDAPKNPLKAPGPLPAPLPLLYQAKVDRKAANDQLSKELEGWNDTLRTMKGIGKEEQAFGGNRLTLPLGASSGPTSAPNAGEVLSKFTANNELEKSVRDLLQSAQLAPKTIAANEAASLASLPPEEAAARIAEVRRQRELLFRAERKAKRVAKIKSKTYHRLQKKARQRAEQEGEGGLTLEELAQLDDEDGGNRAREMREKLEAIRARERATLRHAPGASKWSRAMQGLTGLDDNDRAAYQERADRQDELRRRIAGHDDDSDDYDEQSIDDDADEEAIKASAFDELASFAAKEDAKAAKPSGLAAMKFMQKAQAEQQKAADELEAQFKAELERGASESGEFEEAADAAANPGRKSFAPSRKQLEEQDSTSLPTQSSKTHKVATSGPVEIVLSSASQPSYNPFSAKSAAAATQSETNPWLAIGQDAAAKVSRKQNEATGRDVKAAEKAASKAEKQKKRSEEGKRAAAEAAKVVIDVKPFGHAEDAAADEPVHVYRRLARFDEQQELVARAFAGDDVVAEFEAAKKQEIDRDAPKDIDETLPGWGSWGGKGVRNSKRAPIMRHVPGIDASQRKDAKLSHVIISERRDKKSTKYLVKDLPFPYTSAAQREQALRQPLGKEFATESSNRIATKPSVMVRPGSLVAPVTKG